MDIERIAIGLGAGDVIGREIAAGADAVFNDDRLVEGRLHALGEETCEDIRAAAARKGADDADFARRKFLLRRRCLRSEPCRERQGTEQARLTIKHGLLQCFP